MQTSSGHCGKIALCSGPSGSGASCSNATCLNASCPNLSCVGPSCSTAAKKPHNRFIPHSHKKRSACQPMTGAVCFFIPSCQCTTGAVCFYFLPVIERQALFVFISSTTRYTGWRNGYAVTAALLCYPGLPCLPCRPGRSRFFPLTL